MFLILMFRPQIHLQQIWAQFLVAIAETGKTFLDRSLRPKKDSTFDSGSHLHSYEKTDPELHNYPKE
jgi:hypothetical protein